MTFTVKNAGGEVNEFISAPLWGVENLLCEVVSSYWKKTKDKIIKPEQQESKA